MSMRLAPIAAAVLIIAAATPYVLSGQTLGEAATRSLDEERAVLVTARKAAQEAQARSKALEARARAASDAASRAAAEGEAIKARIIQAQAELAAAEQRRAIVMRLQAQQRAALDRQRQPIAALTGALTQLTRTPALAALVQPGSTRDAVHMRIVLTPVVSAVERRTATLRQALSRSRALGADATMATTALAAARQGLADRQQQLARFADEQRGAARSFASGADDAAEQALALAESERDIVSRMAIIADAGAVRARLQQLPEPIARPLSVAPGPQAVKGATARYRLPVAGQVITGFGEMNDGGVHARGITLAVEPGATVKAPSRGEVAFAGPYRGYGEIIIIDHGGGWTTLVAGLGSLNAAKGDMVEAGRPIGTAPASRPRITIELRRNGQPMDVAAMIG